MGLSVTFVSGLRGSGKSTLIRRMIDSLYQTPPHYIRLVHTQSNKHRPAAGPHAPPQCGVATARWLDYDDAHIFEILPTALTAIHKDDRFGSVIIEADAEPSLRHAYPYDNRLFVMPLPESNSTVFRDPRRAAAELERVLDDTAVFAAEIFGLFTEPGQEEVDPPEARPDITCSQMRGFLNSPLGDELATRIQLQQPYHGMVESDVIVVNPGVGRRGPQTAECLRRIERLVARVRGVSNRHTELFLCDLRDDEGNVCEKLMKAIEPMCLGGK